MYEFLSYQCYHSVVLIVMCNSSALSGINYLVIYLKQIVLAGLGNEVAKQLDAGKTRKENKICEQFLFRTVMYNVHWALPKYCLQTTGWKTCIQCMLDLL